ncbi:hypothetical protein HaLaN_32463 [Haematococcus lacustris]|uniref:Uncharacterized protein n=1 Tax=Haematococcus lacustris TaxID=44745 RepID=A0A6A0AJN2_HAELA|nr:hypothetical protein HaLaN_32463 [Haematococcus lacustris]
MLAEHIPNADALDLAGVLDAAGLGEGGLGKLVGLLQALQQGELVQRGVHLGLQQGGLTWTTPQCRAGLCAHARMAPSPGWPVCSVSVMLARVVGVKAGCEGAQVQYRQIKKLDNGQGVELATVQTTVGRRPLDGILDVASNPDGKDGVVEGRDDREGWTGKMDMRQVCLWSDRSASQFKGAKATRLHWHLANRFGVPVQWSYGATSHFKSTHDSEGGVSKR